MGERLWVPFVSHEWSDKDGFRAVVYPVEAARMIDGRDVVRGASGHYYDRTAEQKDSEIEAKQAILAVLVQRIAKLEAQYDDLLQDVRRQRMEDNA